MNHEELMKKLDTVICNLNDDGLALMYYFIGDMHEIEKYNINTSSDRLEEIKLLEKRQDAKEEEVKQKRKLEEMEAEERKKKATISSLTGKERKFWDKIEKVCKMDISRYTMKTWQTMLLAKIYNNNYLDASYKTFCFGFHQGLKYAENRMKTQKLV